MSDLSFQNIGKYKLKKNEKFMNLKQIEHFKNKLVLWRQQLINDAESTKSHIKEDTTKVADINDRATLEEEFTLELKTRDRERQLINKIDKTLHTIELGNYGYCKTCGDKIGINRLEARPTADECIDCKTVAEKKEV